MNNNLIIENARIYTMDEKNPWASKVAIKKGKIVEFDESVDAFRNLGTIVMDAEGKTILPGFVESHAHPLDYAVQQLGLKLNAHSYPTIESILDAVSKKAKETPVNEWIIGSGWDDSKVEEKRFPTIEELSQAAPEHPVFLIRTCGHNAVANKKAFEICNLDANPKDPQGGRFHRDSRTNKLSGLVQENAMKSFSLPSPTVNEMKQAMLQAQQQFFEWGITAIHDMAVTKKEMNVYQQLKREGELHLKLRMWLWSIDQLGAKGIEEEALALGIESNYGNDHLNIQGLKYMLDGSVGGRTAAVNKPYKGEVDNRGILYLSQKTINKHVERAITNNLRVSIHGIGERAIDMAVKAITKAAAPQKNRQMRHRIEHCALVTEEHLKQMAEHDIIAGSSIGFIYSIGDSYLANLGKERTTRVFPQASFNKYGIKAPGNSDLPICDGNPFFGIYSAVTRKTMSGHQLGTEEAISILDALKAYTIDAAYSGFDESIIGSLEIGKYADMIMLDEDPFETNPEMLKNIRVLKTIIEGNVVYDRCLFKNKY